ncbi:MAG: DUF6029 family protein [Bacteroidia bacterium]|nr:DUF6029 family protein [Bacteroidia bacterium]MCF8426953.1 DUF6029 family protein [Bacteroidia bacterium]MCF8447784.1 DUF6029 family protein [Bacteroidia bacterium]
MIRKLILSIVSLGLVYSVFAQDGDKGKSDKGEFSGNFQTTNQFYVKDSSIGATTTQYQKELSSTDAWLWLNYKVNGYTFKVRFDLFNNSPLLNPQEAYTKSGIGNYSVSKQMDKMNITVGYFYDQFASGMVFRSYEDRNLGLDFAIQGAHIRYTPTENTTIKAFTGLQKFRFDLRPVVIKGVNAEHHFDINDHFSLEPGASMVNRTIDQQTMNVIASTINNYELENRFFPKYNVFVYNIYNTLRYKNFTWNLELAQKTPEAIINPNNDLMELHKGRVMLTSLSYSTKGFGINAQYRYIDKFSLRTSPLENQNLGMIAYLPSITRQNVYRLLARYNAFTQEWGENGVQVDVSYKPKALKKHGTQFNFNTSISTPLGSFEGKTVNPINFEADTNRYFREYYFEAQHKFTKKFKILLGYQIINYNQRLFEAKPSVPYVIAHTYFGEATYKIRPTKSLRIESQYLSTKEDLGSFVNGLIEFNMAPHYSFSFGDMVNIKPGYRNEPLAGTDFKIVHYWNVFGAYTFKNTRFTAGYIRQVEGVNCTGGVCRVEPAFSGVRITLTSNF